MLAGLGATAAILVSNERLISQRSEVLVGILASVLATSISAAAILKWIHTLLSTELNDQEILLDDLEGGPTEGESVATAAQRHIEISLLAAIRKVGTRRWILRRKTRLGRELRAELGPALSRALNFSAARDFIPTLVLWIWLAIAAAVAQLGVASMAASFDAGGSVGSDRSD